MCKKCDIITYAGSGHHLRPDRIEPGAPYFGKSLPGSLASGTHCTFQYFEDSHRNLKKKIHLYVKYFELHFSSYALCSVHVAFNVVPSAL